MTIVSEATNEEPVSIETEVRFFISFVGIMAELKEQFGDILEYTQLVKKLSAGTHTVFVDRSYFITGIAVKDRIVIHPTHSMFFEIQVGHPADFSTLACWGIHAEDDGPICLAYWFVEMLIWKPTENQKTMVPFRLM